MLMFRERFAQDVPVKPPARLAATETKTSPTATAASAAPAIALAGRLGLPPRVTARTTSQELTVIATTMRSGARAVVMAAYSAPPIAGAHMSATRRPPSHVAAAKGAASAAA